MSDPTSTAAPPSTRTTGRRRLGDLLVDAGLLSVEQLRTALQQQRSEDGSRRRLGTVLLELGYVDDRDIAVALAEQLGLEVVAGAALHAASQAVIDLVPRRIASHYDLIPLEFDRDTGELVVAVTDPTNVLALDDLRALPGVRNVTQRVARASAVGKARSLLYERGVADATVQEMHVEAVHQQEDDDAELATGVDDEPVVRLVNALLSDAVRSRASDVHVEPERTGMRVRYRVDGLLREVQRIPRQQAPAVTSRLKVMSHLDIAERRRPQDGRATVRVDGQEVDLRVSTMPSLHGETTVLRLLRKGTERLGVASLGFDPAQETAFHNAMARTQGLIIMTGPTGSGKTTTLYAGLEDLADPTRNVITLEDPIEYQLDGINQTQMNPKIGMTFAAGLRAVLRQDPDVIMVGEIRDAETARLAIEASFTGHLVLSTLHTNDAPSTVARLVELDVERFLLGTTLRLVVAQRLARRVCEHCAVEADPDPDHAELLGLSPEVLAGGRFRRGRGCVECDGTGYLGRVGLYEMLPMSPRMRQLITDGGTEIQIGALARADGMRSLRQDALDKALAGTTTLEEVLRTTPEDQFLHTVGDSAAATAVRVGAIAVHRALVLGGRAVATLRVNVPEGWVLSEADTVAAALDRIHSEDPEVIVVDDLDEATTDEFLHQLRDLEHDTRPVIVRSTRPIDEERATALQALGVVDTVIGHGTDAALADVIVASGSAD